MSSGLAVVGGLAASAVAAAGVGVWTAFSARQRSVLPGAHAHNDYRRNRPLTLALRLGFTSVEVDVFPVAGHLLVGHDRADVVRWRSLGRIYLEPLAARVAEHGAVHPGVTEPFQLLIEVKADREAAWELLEKELANYTHMLTRYEADRVIPGAVSVVITGKPPRTTLAEAQVRYAACDGSLADVGSGVPASLVPMCSEKWAWKFAWKGWGPMPENERALLHRLVEEAHADGRKVRFWGVPSWPWWVRNALWCELRTAGVDYLGADRIGALRAFLRPR